jgi:hypothetical protein
MHRFLFTAMLCTLALVSCEPGDGDADAAGAKPHNKDEKWGKWGDRLPRNSASHEQLFAQASLGKPPEPRDFTSDLGDVCPVHHKKMSIQVIPIVFEDTASAGSATTNPSVTAEFPFGAEKIVSAGNALLPGEPLSARVYQCASCVAARKAAAEKQRQRAASAKAQ